MTLAPGVRLGSYEIVSALGAGGMGEVYKARDPKLQRAVAIKVLATQDADASARLLQEARAASALNHPNICTIHEVGEHEGQAFIVMEHVEGKPLRQLIPADGLPVENVIRYGTQIADAMAQAHERGIVHRDLKSANVVITPEGRAKVLDFGLAARMPQADAEAVTQTQGALPHAGMLVGTLAYMAPEVLRGEAATARSDVWALGVLLYEMASGRLPFERATVTDVIAAVLKEPPEPLPQKVSSGLRAVAQRALAKENGHRYGTSAEVRAALETLGSSGVGETATAASVATPPSIAVLPFTDMSPEKDQDYFCEGIAEELGSDLSKIRSLRVISSTSSRRMKGTDNDIKTVARELHARYLLEGSVRKAGNSLRITARLIDADEDVHLWSEKYGGSLDDVFDIQERVSRSIAEALEIRLTPEDDRRVAERPIQDVRAYEYYLRAKHEIYRFSKEGTDRAVELLRQALDLVGENALLCSALGMAYWQYNNAGVSADRRYLEQAEEYATKALRLDPESASGHFLRGVLLIFGHGKVQESARVLKHALALDPDHTQARLYRAVVLDCAGRDSAAEITKALEVDPLNPLSYVAQGWHHLMMGRFSEAEDQFRRWCRSDPENPFAALLLGDVLARTGSREEAKTVLEQLARRLPDNYVGQIALLLRHALDGDRGSVSAAATPTLTEWAHWDLETTWEMATGYALVGETDSALEWLERAVQRGFINYPFLSQHDPLLESLRKEKRFLALMENVRSQWEQFEV